MTTTNEVMISTHIIIALTFYKCVSESHNCRVSAVIDVNFDSLEWTGWDLINVSREYIKQQRYYEMYLLILELL